MPNQTKDPLEIFELFMTEYLQPHWFKKSKYERYRALSYLRIRFCESDKK